MTDPNKKTPSENKIVDISSFIPAVGVSVSNQRRKKRKLKTQEDGYKPKKQKKTHTQSHLDTVSARIIEAQLSNVIELSLEKLNIVTLSESLSQLTKLKILILDYNRISTLPSAISWLTNLEELHISNNNLLTLPELISTLTNLNELQLGDNNLSTLPASISTLTGLHVLNLNYNQFSTFPSTIIPLKNIEWLDLGDNVISAVPESISVLTNLVTLFLDDNRLTTLPSAISTLTNLEKLNLQGNPLVRPPLSVAIEGIQSIREWFEDQSIIPQLKSKTPAKEMSGNVQRSIQKNEIDNYSLTSYDDNTHTKEAIDTLSTKETLEIDNLLLKKANLQLRNKYLQMKIDKLAAQSDFNKKVATKDVSINFHTKLDVKRPSNSNELLAASKEYARNQEFYTAKYYLLPNGNWYLIDKQKIVATATDKTNVIRELVKLKSDDYLLIQKGKEKQTYKSTIANINEATDLPKVENIEIMAYDKTKSIDGKWNFILDTGSQITYLNSTIINTHQPLFPRLDEISIDTPYGKIDRFKYGCHLNIYGNDIEVEVVPWSQCILGSDVLQHFRPEWDGGRTVSLMYCPTITLGIDETLNFPPIYTRQWGMEMTPQVLELGNYDIDKMNMQYEYELWNSTYDFRKEDIKPNTPTSNKKETKKLDPLQVSNIASRCSTMTERKELESYLQDLQVEHPKSRDILEGIKNACIYYIDNNADDELKKTIHDLTHNNISKQKVLEHNELFGMSLIVGINKFKNMKRK